MYEYHIPCMIFSCMTFSSTLSPLTRWCYINQVPMPSMDGWPWPFASSWHVAAFLSVPKTSLKRPYIMQASAVCALQVSPLVAWCGPGKKCGLGLGTGLEGRMVWVDHICVKGCHLSLDDHEMINHSCNMVEQNSNMQWFCWLILLMVQESGDYHLTYWNPIDNGIFCTFYHMNWWVYRISKPSTVALLFLPYSSILGLGPLARLPLSSHLRNSGKWRFRLGFPTKDIVIPGADCYWECGGCRSNIYVYIYIWKKKYIYIYVYYIFYLHMHMQCFHYSMCQQDGGSTCHGFCKRPCAKQWAAVLDDWEHNLSWPFMTCHENWWMISCEVVRCNNSFLLEVLRAGRFQDSPGAVRVRRTRCPKMTRFVWDGVGDQIHRGSRRGVEILPRKWPKMCTPEV